MANTTRWVFKEKNGKDRFQKLSTKIKNINNSMLEDTANVISGVKVKEEFPEPITQQFGINEIKFNFYNVDFYKTSKIDNTRTEDSFWIILYKLGNDYFIIINKNSGAKTLLRKIFEYKGKNEIRKLPHGIDSKTIIWLISMIYDNDAEYTSSDTLLSIDAINGFKGNTEDSLNTVSAMGSGVMNILSTLSFLLESASLNQIKLTLSFSVHTNLELKINTNNTIDVNEEKYRGALLDKNISENSLICEEYLLVYNEVIPLIREWFKGYENDSISTHSKTGISQEEWWNSFYKKFLLRVSNDLSEKINERKKLLTN